MQSFKKYGPRFSKLAIGQTGGDGEVLAVSVIHFKLYPFSSKSIFKLNLLSKLLCVRYLLDVPDIWQESSAAR